MRWIKCSEEMPLELHDVLVWGHEAHFNYFVMVARWRDDYIKGVDDEEENKPT